MTKVEVTFSDKKFHILVQEQNGMEQKIHLDGAAARHLHDRLGERLDGPTSVVTPAEKAAEVKTPAAPADHTTVIPPVVPATENPSQPEVEKD